MPGNKEKNRYFFRVTGDRQVYIYSDEGLLKVLKGTHAADFLDKVKATDINSAREIMKKMAE